MKQPEETYSFHYESKTRLLSLADVVVMEIHGRRMLLQVVEIKREDDGRVKIFVERLDI